jgi:hypothetical protein
MDYAGDNPVTFNFISFCGHGCINDKGESLYVIPESYYQPEE